MTIKKYLDDAYTLAFNAVVSSVVSEGGQHWISLEETYFYPEGGGQPCDFGTIEGHLVEDVQVKNDIVYHRVAQPGSFAVGQRAFCQIDPERRLDLMCQHSAQHILSAVLEHQYKTHTVGFHLTADNLTIDTDSVLTGDQWSLIETEVNQWVRASLSFSALYPESDDLQQFALRKQPKVTENIRLIALGDRDIVPCGGTHVRHSGEIGLIKIDRIDKYKIGQRVFFCAGQRAIAAMQLESHVSKALSSRFSVPVHQLLASLEQILEKQKELQWHYQLLIQEKAKLEAKALIEASKLTSLVPQSPIVAIWDDQRDAEYIKHLIGALTADKDYKGAIVIGYKDEKGAQFVLRAPSGLNAVEILNTLKQVHPLRGGGSAERIQAGSQDVNIVAAAYQQCLEIIEGTRE